MKMVIVYHPGGAGRWIYEGYKAAWEAKGYEVMYSKDAGDPRTLGEYSLMLVEVLLGNLEGAPLNAVVNLMEGATKVFLFVQPHSFPLPWGKHPNFVTRSKDKFVDLVNNMPNVHLWTFNSAVESEYYSKWKKVNYIPLAFDSINYTPQVYPDFAYDIAFVGGRANNAFDEKKKIMVEYFEEIKKLGIKMGIFIEQNLTVQQEADMLFNSKIAINIHDAYQQKLGLDSNERTFKSLGINGFLISDSVAEVERLFPDVPTAKSATAFAELIKEYLDKDLTEIKKKNKELIMKDHTYLNRVQQMMDL